MEGEPQEKPFQTVDIVILMLITVPKDISTLVAILIVAVPAVGQIYFFLDKLFSGIVWAIIQIYFYWKTGSFGRAGVANIIGGSLAGFFGIPGAETISTLVAIHLANHPKVIETVVNLGGAAAATAVTGGIGGAAVAGKGVAAAGTAGKAGATAGGAIKATEGAAAESGAKTGAAAQKSAPAGEKAATDGETGKGVSPQTLGEPESEFQKMEKLTQEPLPIEKKNGEDEGGDAE